MHNTKNYRDNGGDKWVVTGELEIKGAGKITKDGVEVTLGGGGGTTPVTAANISDASAVGRQVITAANPAAVRTAIGAGTSNLAIGTTNTTAKAGDYAPPNAAPAVRGLVLQAAASPDTAATDVAGVLAELRDLKAKLKAAGIMA